MQKLSSVQHYYRLDEDDTVAFTHPEWQPQARQIKMKVNAPQAVNLYLTRLDDADPETGELVKDQEHFLAHIPAGLEELDFWDQGSCALHVVGGAIWLSTLDSSSFLIAATDDSNYARVWEREEENPQVLEYKRLARYNERVLAEQRAADRAEREAFLAEIKGLTNVPTPPAITKSVDPVAAPGVAPVGATGGVEATPPAPGTDEGKSGGSA